MARQPPNSEVDPWRRRHLGARHLLLLAGIFLLRESAIADLSAEEKAAIREASARYVAAMQNNDWDAVSSSFTTDAVRMPPNEPLHEGREAIRRWLSQVERVSQYELTVERISGLSGLAYVSDLLSDYAAAQGGAGVDHRPRKGARGLAREP